MTGGEVDRSSGVSRREMLGWLGAAAVAGVAGPRWSPGAQASGRAGAFRIVHLADIHVQPELRGEEGFLKCLEAVHALDPRPDLILAGGDLVMDVLDVDEPRAKMLFDMYVRICRDSDIPIRNCVGNHDVFGWSSKGKIAPDHVSYGKAMVQERLELSRTTYRVRDSLGGVQGGLRWVWQGSCALQSGWKLVFRPSKGSRKPVSL